VWRGHGALPWHDCASVSTSLKHTPPSALAEAEKGPPGDTLLRVHPLLCELGLPIRAPRGQWQRDIGIGSLRMEASSPDQALPSGRLLRLSLIHICDAAFHANSASLDLGEDASAWADRIGAGGKTADLIDQMHRMLAAKISLSWRGGPEFTLFDARSRSRGDVAEWRAHLRLSTKFLASLTAHAVALDPDVLRALGDSPVALDAYAWIRHSLSGGGAGATRTISWNDLLSRFGMPSQNVAAFRGVFEPALRLVFDADPSIEIAVDEEGVSVRHTPTGEMPAEVAAPEPAAAESAPAPSPERPPAIPSPAPRVAAPIDARPAAAGVVAAARRPESIPAPPADRITEDRICLPRDATGLSQCIWLRRGHGSDQVLVGVTPGTRFDPEKLTVLAVEPMILQVSGGLHQGDFDRVSAWIMANRDLVDDFWDDRISSFSEINERVRKAPAPGWR